MSSLVTTPPLGSKENPHPYKFGQKNRTKGHYYLSKKAELRYYNGNRLINKEKKKQWYEKNIDKIKEQKKVYHIKNKHKKKEYREKNKDKIKERNKEYRNKNKDKIKEQNNEYRNKNKDKIKERNMEYYQENKDKIKEHYQENKDKINTRNRKRYENDQIYKLKCNLRSRMWYALKAQDASKNKRTLEYINCSVALLYYHIEEQFTDGMNWKNHGYGKGKWNVDHRRPCDSFDLNDEEQMYMCFHWTNLQPMWHVENCHEKRDTFDPKTFRYKWIDRETGWVGIPSYLMNK